MTGFFWVDDEDEDKCLDNILIRFIACIPGIDVRKHVVFLLFSLTPIC